MRGSLVYRWYRFSRLSCLPCCGLVNSRFRAGLYFISSDLFSFLTLLLYPFPVEVERNEVRTEYERSRSGNGSVAGRSKPDKNCWDLQTQYRTLCKRQAPVRCMGKWGERPSCIMKLKRRRILDADYDFSLAPTQCGTEALSPANLLGATSFWPLSSTCTKVGSWSTSLDRNSVKKIRLWFEPLAHTRALSISKKGLLKWRDGKWLHLPPHATALKFFVHPFTKDQWGFWGKKVYSYWNVLRFKKNEFMVL